MEHKNEIAIKLLRHEYSDYDVNSWHYDRLYNMLVEAQNLALYMEGLSNGQHAYSIGDKAAWRGMELLVAEVGKNEVLLATHVDPDNDDYNDWWVDVIHVKLSL